MLIDKVKVYVKAGDGGNGAVTFRREKYVSHGGPDGGDGGRGGNIIITIDEGTNTLLDYKNRRKFIAQNGENGSGAKFHGGNGKDTVLPVPPGTVIKDAESGLVIKDMSEDGEPFVLCRGGKGGWGNRHFATPTRRTPRFAKSGLKGEEREVIFELKMIADVGLIGFPSVGKSSILSVISAARPKIAEYHFTTLSPNLGVVRLRDGRGFVAADIPGLIEGASEGAGLGHAFLRHIERCRMLLHVVDVSGMTGRDPVEDIITIESAISETEWDIENLSGTLRHYDALVDYATIDVELSEVYKLSGQDEAVTTFGGRLGQSFVNGLKAVGNALEDFAVWLAYSWVWLLVIAAVIVVVVRIVRRKSGGKKFSLKRKAKTENTEPKE